MGDGRWAMLEFSAARPVCVKSSSLTVLAGASSPSGLSKIPSFFTQNRSAVRSLRQTE